MLFDVIINIGLGQKHPNLGTLKFLQASQQQGAGIRASVTASRVCPTTLAAQNMGSCAGKLSEAVWGGHWWELPDVRCE